MTLKIEKSWKSLVASCRIPARAKSASAMLGRYASRYYADSVDPVKFKCTDCGQEDERITTNRDEWVEITCSNCYSESVMIAGIRLTFFDWGEQNGGKKERDDRYSFAEDKLREERASA